MRLPRPVQYTLLAATLVVALSVPVQAQESGILPTKDDFIKWLTPDSTGRLRGGRGLSFVESTTPSAGPQVGGLYFELGSADLTERAKNILTTMAEALRSEQLLKYRYTITGHTDPRGSDAFNSQLSVRRADSVTGYLIAHGVSSFRLTGTGVGKADLADPEHPNSEVNRRVVVDVAP